MKKYLKKHYRLLSFNTLLLIILIAGVGKFIQFTSNVLDILYIQQSVLNKYFNDFYLASHLQPSETDFLQKLQKKDERLYDFFKEGKLQLEKTLKGYHFIWKSSKKKTNMPLSELMSQSFFKKILFNENILIKFNNEEWIDYQENMIYRYDNHQFKKISPFDRQKIQRKYAEQINCPPYKIFVEDPFKQSAYVLIRSGKVNLIHSDFSHKNEEIIKISLEEIYKEEKDTFLIHLRYYNQEDAVCME